MVNVNEEVLTKYLSTVTKSLEDTLAWLTDEQRHNMSSVSLDWKVVDVGGQPTPLPTFKIDFY